jgi:ubiquinone/menaquinone biosynthesis C-methylase UbiE
MGVDFVPGLIAAARDRAEAQGLSVTFEVKAAHDLSFPAESFDAVLCSHGVYSLTPTSRRRIELLQVLTRLLRAEGVLVLWAGWYRDRGPRLALVDGLRRLMRQVLGERFPTEPGDRLVRHLSFASDPRDQCFYHVFQGPEEICREIVAAGLIGEMDPDGAWLVRKPG